MSGGFAGAEVPGRGILRRGAIGRRLASRRREAAVGSALPRLRRPGGRRAPVGDCGQRSLLWPSGVESDCDDRTLAGFLHHDEALVVFDYPLDFGYLVAWEACEVCRD